MTDIQKTIETTITRLECKIDSYKRNAERAKRQAFSDGECGYRESAEFNRGQQFALEYVVYDLQIILNALKEI